MHGGVFGCNIASHNTVGELYTWCDDMSVGEYEAPLQVDDKPSGIGC